MKNNLDSHLFVLIGPSGVGKSTILRYFESQYAAESAPKYTIRPSRGTVEDARDFIFCSSNNFPTEAILTFESYGQLFGIQLDAIAESFLKGRPHVTIVGHCDVVKKLSCIYGNKLVVIFVFCDISVLRDRILGKADLQRSARWSAICEETSEIYSQLGCVNFVINNSNSLQSTFEQIDKIISKLILVP